MNKDSTQITTNLDSSVKKKGGHSENTPNTTEIILLVRGATGAVRAPKPDKTPNRAAPARCRRPVLFFKIKVRLRSYPLVLWRPC